MSDTPLGASIALEKNLPVAAGLGGGSADAAAVLRALNVLWSLGRSEDELVELARTLGSDVPACVLSRPCWMEGRGEQVSATPPLPPLELVLVNPGVLLPTAGRIRRASTRAPAQARWSRPAGSKRSGISSPISRIPATIWKRRRRFLQPVIDDVLEALHHEPACVFAQMSGSGATCFGLFNGREYAQGAAERIALDHPSGG